MFWSRLRSFVRRLFRRGLVERQLDDELESYIEHQIDARVADGMTPADARRQALLELGGREQVKEQVRAHRTGNWLESIVTDLRHAFRIHAERPGLTGIALLTLALGIGAATTTFSMLDTILLRPLPYRNPEQLVEVWATFPGWRDDPTLAPLANEVSVPLTGFRDWMERQTVFQDAALFVTYGETSLAGGETPQELWRGHATHNLFRMLGVTAELGRVFDPRGGIDEASTAILAHDAWRRLFGEDEDVIGRSVTLNLDGRQNVFTVIGVLPADFDFRKLDSQRDPPPEIWLSMEHDAAPEDGEVIARLRPGVTISRAEEETARMFAGLRYDSLLLAWSRGTSRRPYTRGRRSSCCSAAPGCSC